MHTYLKLFIFLAIPIGAFIILALIPDADATVIPTFNESVVVLSSSTTNPSSLDPSPLYHESCDDADQTRFICR